MPAEFIFCCHRCLQPYPSEPWALNAWSEILPEESHCEACRATPDDFDRYVCPTYGRWRYSLREVRQEVRDEVGLYVCTACGQVADLEEG